MDEHNRPRVGVLYGGISSEREVSLVTGRAVGRALRRAGYPVEMIDIREVAIKDLAPDRMDVAFVALHGTFGEDGGIQSVLGVLGVPYTGSGVEASRWAMDKIAAKERFQKAGLPTPAHVELEARWPHDQRLQAARGLGLPVVLKPVNEGSSVGVTLVESDEQLAQAVDQALEFDHRALAEQYVPGRELTVGVVDGKPLPIIELIYQGKVFTYDVKYTEGAARHIVDPDLPPGLGQRVQRIAVAAHRCLHCSGCTRVDMRLDERLRPYVLEVNTIPGMTPTSLLPDAARAAGISFAELCGRTVALALRDHAGAEAHASLEV
ncbi:MAG: D-alanine--D-alanine ligase [Candidatus Brocadiia bacterium]